MPSRKDRFGRLGGGSGDAKGPGQTADLFEHYGIPLDSPESADPAPGDGMAAVAAKACRRCGWFVALGSTDPCPVCAEVKPLVEPPKAAKSK